jgi:glycosyltransferase 2 family protein
MSAAGMLETSAVPAATRGDPRRSWRPIALTAGGLIVVFAVLLRLRALDWGRLVAAFRSLGVTPLVFGLVGGFGVVALQALRWWVVTRPVLRVHYGQAYGALLLGGLLNAILPARAGDLLRVQYLADRAKVSRATLYGTELVDFWTDKSGWLPAFALLGLTGAPPPWMWRALGVMAALSTALLWGVLLLRGRQRGAVADDAWQSRFVAGLAASSPARLAVTALLVAALPWLWEALAIQIVASAAEISLPPLHAFALLTAFNIAMVVPVPGGLGVHEAASTAV